MTLTRQPLAVALTSALCALSLSACSLLNPGTATPAVTVTVASSAPATSAPAPAASSAPATSAAPASSAPTATATVTVTAAPASSAPPATTAPAAPATTVGDNDPLTFDGIGALRLGMTIADAQRYGLAKKSDVCDNTFDPTPRLVQRGIGFRVGEADRIALVTLANANHRTESGVRVGMPASEVKRLYGDKVQWVTVDGVGGKHRVMMITYSTRQISFLMSPSGSESGVVSSIILQEKSSFVGFDGC